MVVAYVRVSTDKQELDNQRFEIERFCQQRGYIVDEWDSEVVSGTAKVKERRIGRVLERLSSGDTLIVSEISRLSRRLVAVLNIIEDAIERGITIVSVKENLTVGDDLNSRVVVAAFGLAAQIERSLISARTKEALARKRADGVKLGRPVGSTKPEHYKLHGKDEKILRLMDKRVSKAAIARLLDVNRETLRRYMDRQDLHNRHLLRRLSETGVS